MLEPRFRQRRRLGEGERRRNPRLEPREHLRFILQRHRDAQDEVHIRLVARIDRLFERHDAFELLRRAFQLAENQRIQRFRGEIEGEGERIETKHGELPSLMRNEECGMRN